MINENYLWARVACRSPRKINKVKDGVKFFATLIAMLLLFWAIMFMFSLVEVATGETEYHSLITDIPMQMMQK